jgi:hypothetical protein
MGADIIRSLHYGHLVYNYLKPQGIQFYLLSSGYVPHPEFNLANRPIL